MSLYDKISEARGAGYSDDEILEGLRKKYPVMGGKIDTAIAEQYNPTEIVDFLSKREAPGTPKAKAPAGASYDAFTGTFTPETKENADPLKAGTALLAGIKRLPQEIGATLIQTAKGQSGATVTDKGILDRFLDENERAREEFVKQYGSEAQILPGMPISVKDVAELPSNLAFSVTSAGAGLGAGGAALFATKNPTVAWGTGMAASGAAAYRMASNQIMQQYLDAMNETAREQFGRDITPEEEAKLKNKFSNLATAYGLWEAIPEAIGNVAELKVLLKPLSKMVGQNVASKIIKKIAGTYGTELGTETITKTGQQQVESQMGLTDEAPRSFASPSDWAKSASEVAPQVFLLTTVMGGTIGGANLAYRKYTSKKLSQTVQDITGKDMTSLQDEEVDNLLANAKELKKKRSFDKKLDDSIEKIEAEAERRKTAAPVVEGEAEEVTPEVSTMPPLPQDFFDQMRGYVVAGKDSKGRPFDLDTARHAREVYATQPGANPESIRLFDEFIEDAAMGNVEKPTEDTTQLMHSLRADAMQGLSMEDLMARGNDLKGRHPKLADDINKLIIEFQGKKVPGVVEPPVQTEAQAPVIPPVEAAETRAEATPAPEKIAPPAPAEEVLPGSALGFQERYAEGGDLHGMKREDAVAKSSEETRKNIERLKEISKNAPVGTKVIDGEIVWERKVSGYWSQGTNEANYEIVGGGFSIPAARVVYPSPAPAGEAVAPKPTALELTDRQRDIFVKELMKSEAPEVQDLVKQTEETWPGEDPEPVVESQIDYDLQKAPEKWLGTAAGKEILARKGWVKDQEPERAPEGPRKLTLYRGGKAGNWYTTTEEAAREYANLGEGGKVLKEDVTFKKVAEKADILKAADAVGAKPDQALYWLVSPETSEDAPKVIAELKKQGFDAAHLPEGEDFAPSGKGIESYLKLEAPAPKAEKREGISPSLKTLILMDMRTALEEGHKYGMRDDETVGQGSNAVPIGTTNPPWLMDIIRAMKAKHKQTVGKGEILAVIRRELEGKDFSPKQMKIWFLIEDHLRNESANPHYMKAEEVMTGAATALEEEFSNRLEAGEYDNAFSDLSFPPTEKEIETAAINVVASEVANGNEEALQEYQAERGEAHREENEAPAAKVGPAEEVTPKTEKTKAGEQGVIPGASFADTFDLTPSEGEIGQPAPATAAGPKTATVEEVAGEMEKPAEAAQKPKKPKKEKPPTRGDIAKEFYQPGNIIYNGYWKIYDKVLEVKGEIGKEGWQVKVQKVDKDGKPLEGPRWHSTLPDKTDRIEKKAEARQPWEMTKKEYANSGNELSEAYHRNAVISAFGEGKPVPQAVLDEYPELKAPAGKIEDFGEKIGGARKDTAERGYSMTGKAKKEETGPAWRKNFVVMERVGAEGWVIVKANDKHVGFALHGRVGQVFATKEEAEKAIPLYAVAQNHSVYQNDDKTYSIYKRVSDRKRLKVVNKDFPSREDAMKHMAVHAEELLNLKTSFGEEILPVPEIAVRKGVERRTGPATPEMFMETFAPRGIEFGNWNNQEERQQVMNHAYDGLLDLADALGLPPKALMLNGELAIAFGARGQGLTGAKAHYEPGYGIINLTKMKGAGSLAHEWLHALDHYLGRQDTPSRGERRKNERGDMVFPTTLTDKEFASSGFRVTDSGVRKELRDAFESLLQSMYKRAEQYVEDTKQADKFLGVARKSLSDMLNNIRADLSRDLTAYHKSKGGYSNKPIKFFEPAPAEQLAEFDRLASILVEGGDLETSFRNTINPEKPEDAAKLEKIKSRRQRFNMANAGRHTNDTLEALNAIIKAARNHQGFNKEQTGALDKVRAAMGTYKARIKMFEDAQAGSEKTRMRPTSYAIEAKKMDQARASNYWSDPKEMAARAFAAYVEDKIAENGGQSDFLVYHAHGGIILPMIDGFIARPYPEGAEREAINKEFDKFISTIQTRETPQGVEMYEVLNPLGIDDRLNRYWKTKLEEQHERDGAEKEARARGPADDSRRERDEQVSRSSRLQQRRLFDENMRGLGKGLERTQWEGVVFNPDWGESAEFRVAQRHFQYFGYTAVPISKVSFLGSVNPTLKAAFVGEMGADDFAYFMSHETSHILSKQGHPAVTAIKDNLDVEHPDFRDWMAALSYPEEMMRDEIAASIVGGWDRYKPILKGPKETDDRNIREARKATLGKDAEKYSVRDLHRRGLLKPAKLEDVKKFFPGQEVGLDKNGNMYVKTRGGVYATIYKVERIEADPNVLMVGYGTSKLNPGAVIPGAMGVTATGEFYIKLHNIYGDAWTLSHEGLGHLLESANIINSLDVAALRGHIKRLHREGKWETANKKDIGGPEDRANFIADRLAVKEQNGPIGRIILRIRAFIDGILESFGIRNPESILRGIESGRFMERTGREGKGEERFDVASPTDTKAFKEWFKKSKVVDADGNPLVVYHSGSFSEEEDIPAGAMHFGTKEAAQERSIGKFKDDAAMAVEAYQNEDGEWHWDDGQGLTSEDLGEGDYGDEDSAIAHGRSHVLSNIDEFAIDVEGGTITAAYLSIQNPKRVTDAGGASGEWEDVIKKAKAEGHDGIVYRNRYEDKGKDSYIAFFPTQIKSVYNRGTFSRTNPNIMFEIMTPDLPDFMKEYLTEKAAEVEKEYPAFAFDEKSTKGEGWWQLHPSEEFKNYFRKDEWPGVPKAEGVSFIIGTRNGRQEPQAIRFDKRKITEDQAAAWWERNKKQFATANLFRPKAMEMPAFDAKPKELNSWLNNETELNMQAMLKREKDLAKKGAERMLPSNLPHNTWLENMLKSFEWMDHPVLSRIVKIMMSTRSELYHENFNHMTENKVIEATRALRRKGLTPADRVLGRTSEEYKLFGRMIDYLDNYWKRDKKQTREEQLKAQEKWMRDNGATDDIVKVWRLHRETYDRGLDLMTAQHKAMLEEVKKREAEEAPLFFGAKDSPATKLRQTLEYHLAQMDEWKGSYAPRVRNRGSWWVWAHRGEGEAKEYVMDFRGSSFAADRLAEKLKAQGWTVTRTEEAKKLPEDIQQQLKTVSVARAIEKALDDMKHNGKGAGHSDLLAKFHEELLENVSDEIKARGFRSSMIHRNTDRIVKGYKEDPLERLVIYTNNTSAGLAKATTAKMAINELFGEKDKKGNHIGGIDPVKEPRVFSTAQLYIEEQLRNADQTDRWIGVAKAIATFKYLGFNVRSAFVNTTALVTTAPPAIQQYALDGKVGFHKVMNELAKASNHYRQVMMEGSWIGDKLGTTANLSADERAFLEDIKRKGYDDPQYTREAMGSIQKTQYRALSMAMDASMYIFGKTEQWNRGTTMLAAYRLARKQGFTHEEAEERAKLASDKAHGIYGKATMPAWAMGKNPFAKVGQLMYVYGKFSHNYLQMLYDLGFKKHNLKAFAFASLAPLVVGGMAALPFKDYWFKIGGIIFAPFLNGMDPEKWVWDQIRKNFGSTAEAVGRHGVTGAMGLDISSSLSIGVGVPKGLGDLAGPAGGVWEDVTEAWRYGRQGQAWRAAEKLAPRALDNPLKAYRESQEGATTRHGYRVWDEKGKPFKPTEGEAAVRAFGFRSTRQAVISERTNEAKREIKTFTDRKSAIYERYRAYLAGKKDPAEHREITRKVREYNDGLKSAGIAKEEVPRITFESMRRQAERMRKPTKQQRSMLAD